jgi:glycosyltransferase involved in cell wall biosynthesis
MPTVLLESMALGTPCVSTDVTGIPEILIDRQTGLMVPQGTPDALSEALEAFLKDSDLRVRISKEARGLIEERFDIHRNTAVLRSLFVSQREALFQQQQEIFL